MNDDPLIGTELAGYHITSLIGRGGMGVVYRAENSFGAQVAIKVMAPEISGNRDFRERFIRESESAIEHPNVVPIFETGASGDLLYIVMFHVDGFDLKAMIESEGRLLPARAASIFVQAAAALDAAHENGIVHRDVKPQNILIEERAKDTEHVYLTDFGLVKRASSQSSRTSSTYLMGSVFYMSPEHIEGRMIDGRADVYGLGCVLYEALTGSVPFEKENEVAVLWSHVNEEPPKVTSKVPVLSSGIDDVVAKAMAKSADDRFLTAGEFATAVATQLGAPAPRRATWAPSAVRASGAKRISGQRPRRRTGGPIAAPRRSPTPALAAAVITLLGLSSFAVAGLRADRPDGSAGLAASSEGHESNGVEARPVSEDAAKGRVSWARGEKGHTLTPDNTSEPLGSLTISGVGEVLSTPAQLVPRGSPLARTKIVFHHHYDDPATGGTEAQGTQSGGELYMIDADGTNRVRLTFSGKDQKEAGPAWSACGHLAYETRGDLWYTSRIPGTRHRRLVETDESDGSAAWSPDCRRVVFTQGTGSLNAGFEGVEVSDWKHDIYLVDSDGSELRNLTESSSRDASPTWSPDGRHIAFASDRDGDWEIFVMKPDGSGLRKLTDNLISDIDPAWSPDGRRIAFARSPHPTDQANRAFNEDLEIWVMNTDGSGGRQLTDDKARDSAPVWSPDGKWLLYFHRVYQGDDLEHPWFLWVMRADGAGKRMWLAIDHLDRPTWQVPHHRVISIQKGEQVIAGRVRATNGSCAISQPINIQGDTADGWKTVSRTVTNATGRFNAPIGDPATRYRAVAPFFINSSTDLCGPAFSRIV